MSVQLGSLAIVGGVKTKFAEAPSAGQKAILIGNESGLTCTITMEGGGVQKTLYPSTLDWFAVKPGFSGVILINPITILTNTASWPASSLVFDAIGINDPEEASMYPLALARNTNIGNTVPTTGGSTTSVTNDNQPLTPSNQFIEATPTGAAGSTVVIATDGTMTIKGDVANVLTTLLQLIPTVGAGASSVILGDAARTVEVLGKLLVDGASTHTGLTTATGGILLPNNVALESKDAGGTIRNLMFEDGSNIIQHNAGNQQQFEWNNASGTRRVVIDTGDVNALLDLSAAAAIALKLTAGSLSAMVTVGDTSIAQAGTSVAHTLGAIPTSVIPVLDAGAAGSADVIKINYGTMTSTHFTAYTTNAGGTGNVRFLVYGA